MHSMLKAAIESLACVCDGASTQDGVGFNGSDTGWGKSLAIALRSGAMVSPDEQRSALERLAKYSNQLLSHGAALPTSEELERHLEEYAAVFQEAENRRIQECRDRYQAIVESGQIDGETHPAIGAALIYLDGYLQESLNNFARSLLDRLQCGRDLSEKQQRSGLLMLLAEYGKELDEVGFSLSEEELDRYLVKWSIARSNRSH